MSPKSIKTISSSITPNKDSNIMIDCPRLTAPRDLQIPKSTSTSNVKVSLGSQKDDVLEVFRSKVNESIDIWDVVTKMDQDIPEDIWDYVSKLPPVNDRQIIATSAREMLLWRQTYGGQISDLNIISEKLFIRHLMYLIIGIETNSFPFNEEANCFCMKDNLVLEGVSKELLKGYVSPLLVVGTYYKRLYNFAFNMKIEDTLQSGGLIYEAAREVIRQYLLDFRLTATDIYEECSKNVSEDSNCMPTLLQILHHIEPLKYEIETMVSIYKLSDSDSSSSIPRGAELMSYMFNEISLVTHKTTALVLYNSLFSICKVYYKFIERFIFEGELDDPYNEFFIRKDSQYVNSRSKRYWDKGFYIVANSAIPEFLRPLASFILLCGKSLRLLKLCNPGDPLVALLSAVHPSVRACSGWAGLERARRLLRVYRTRCLFVAGERASLQRLLLQRDAERKAFAEMATLKQAETMEKIVAERKRLAQLIIAEKQHSLKVLEAAMAETRAAKNKVKQRERKLHELEAAAEKATEEVDSKLKEDESNKIMEYYSKLNMEVEKSKLHTEWKIKRLQLDESRMQLLSTEERNLKREKLELEHQRNEDVMAMSIQSIDFKSDDDEAKSIVHSEETLDNVSTDIDNTSYENANEEAIEIEQTQNQNAARYKAKAQSSNDMFSAICNVAKSIFGVGRQKEEACDNEVKIDTEGNIVSVDEQRNVAANKVTNYKKIESNTNQLNYLERKQAALQTKQRVMAHELGYDNENNQVKSEVPEIKLTSVDEENNFEDNWCFAEARKNKIRVLGAEFGDTIDTPIQQSEPRNIAQKEALINKQKVLGVEYNQPAVNVPVKEPANIAQEEALRNKQKVLGVEYNLPAEKYIIREPANLAQEEAIMNKQKVLGVEYNLPAEKYTSRESANLAQEEAVMNKQKVLGVEYNLPAENYISKEPANVAQEEAIMNKQKVLGADFGLPVQDVVTKKPSNIAQEEAIVNRNKILGVEYNLPAESVNVKDPANIAQEEALRNKKKVLGVEYNLPMEVTAPKEPLNAAQEAALKNRNKVLGSEYELGTEKGSARFDSSRKSNLRLNLKPYNETDKNVLTPNTAAVMSGELYPGSVQLDLETPTTAEMPIDAATCDALTPKNEYNKYFESSDKSHRDYLTSEGFNFSLIVEEENIESEIDQVYTPDTSPIKVKSKSTVNILDGSYSLENFDPFGVKEHKHFSTNYFENKINDNNSNYTHPSIIMENVKRSPCDNNFASRFEPDIKEDEKITCDNIVTLTACLQRSVMLPLTYQLEVVNNSILTYFLINLDMYEHLKSLKDYFFLMDGEFSRSICHNLFSKLTKTVNPQELLNFATLHNILDKALGSSILHIHKFSENLSFTISDSPLSFQHSSPDVLQCLSLTYSVSWPLNIILSQEALARYAKVFQFLIKMRRISWVLSEDFQNLKLSVKLLKLDSRKLLRSPQYISIQIYRHIMSSLMRALDNYIVTTCILSSWNEFETDLKKANTLDDLYECHVVYIKKVLFRCLLNNRSTLVMKLLNDMFTVILKFSRVLKAGEWQQKETGCYTHPNFVQLEELFHLFEKLAKYLHKVVTKLTECGYQRHLVELLTMVNLNGYYDPEKSKDDTNTSIQST
ncbi:gamma-tubulin complex component 6 isoform X2 [Aricia agestis]|nr:gamma-tubulin complex component 6 isoform X2 [Aricia agestis]